MAKRFAITLPSWLSVGDIDKLKAAAEQFWAEVGAWAEFPLQQQDGYLAEQPILGLLAWERGIKRLPGEDIVLFRLRIKHAVENAEDAGSTEGFERIFKRLGFNYVETLERQDGTDWDVITIRLNINELTNNLPLIGTLIQSYGRTCRRYVVSTLLVSAEQRSHILCGTCAATISIVESYAVRELNSDGSVGVAMGTVAAVNTLVEAYP